MICIVKSTLIILLLTFMNNSVLYVRAVDTIETNLPEPRFESEMSIEETLYQRASIRQYTDEALTLEGISQLLWAAQGENQKEHPDGSFCGSFISNRSLFFSRQS